jgi:chorismate mutase
VRPIPVLAGFRKSIDNIDAALIHMLAERFRITQAVGEYKARGCPPAIPTAKPARSNGCAHWPKSLPISIPNSGEKFLRFIIDEVIRHHQPG